MLPVNWCIEFSVYRVFRVFAKTVTRIRVF